MKRLGIAVGLQVLAGLITGAMLATDYPPAPAEAVPVLYLATTSSQCALLAIWGSVGSKRTSKRAAGLVAGTIYLWLNLAFAMGTPGALDQWLIAFALVACAIGALWASLMVTSGWRPGFAMARDPSADERASALQFSLRHIMVLVVAVAVVLTAGRLVRATEKSDTLEIAAVCIVLAVCLAEASLAALWATLSQGPIIARLGVAMGLALLTGFIPPFYFDLAPRDYFLVMLVAIVSQAFTIATLLVARRCGYRLIRRESPPTLASEASGELVAHALD
jgi:hypothetical protein